mgnify:FL=1
MSKFKFYFLALFVSASALSLTSCEEDEETNDGIENPAEEAKKGGDIVGQWAINKETSETVIGDETSQGMMAFIPKDFDLNQVVNVLGDEVTFNEDGTLLADGKEGTFVTDNGTLSITTTPIEGGNPMTINGEADLKPIVDNLFPDYAAIVQSAKMSIKTAEGTFGAEN